MASSSSARTFSAPIHAHAVVKRGYHDEYRVYRFCQQLNVDPKYYRLHKHIEVSDKVPDKVEQHGTHVTHYDALKTTGVIIPILQDNYTYLVKDNESGQVYCIDPADAEPVKKVLDAYEWCGFVFWGDPCVVFLSWDFELGVWIASL